MTACFALTGLLLFSNLDHSQSQWSEDLPNVRLRFYHGLAQLQGEMYEPGQTMDEVRELLGEPDDIVTERDQSHYPGHVTWCYGCAGHLSLATLGTVTFNESGRIVWVQGNDAPPNEGLIAEPLLRHTMRVIHRARVDFTGPDDFHPRAMIEAVNTLRELGKQKALQVLTEYSRVQSVQGQDHNLSPIILMRFLFVVPPDETHPTTYLPFENHKSAAFPAFPAVVLDGIPLYIFPLGGWCMAGGLPNCKEYFEWYERNGTLIEKPLRPIDNPLQSWQTWTNGLRVTIAASDTNQAAAGDKLVMLQLLRLVDTVHARKFDDDTIMFHDISVSWDKACASLKGVKTHWDEVKGFYVRTADGSFFEPIREPMYQRVIWELPVDGRRARLVVNRLSESMVEVSLEQQAGSSPVVPDMKVRVFPSDEPKIILAERSIQGSFTQGTQASVGIISLNVGTNIKAELWQDDQLVAESPILQIDAVNRTSN